MHLQEELLSSFPGGAARSNTNFAVVFRVIFTVKTIKAGVDAVLKLLLLLSINIDKYRSVPHVSFTSDYAISREVFTSLFAEHVCVCVCTSLFGFNTF